MDLILLLMGFALIIELEEQATKSSRERQIIKFRDAILRELRSASTETKRIRGLPRGEVDALIAETVSNSNQM